MNSPSFEKTIETAMYYINAKNFDTALFSLNRALELDISKQQKTLSYNLMAVAYGQLEQLDNAVLALEKSIALGDITTNGQSYLGLLKYYITLKKVNEAQNVGKLLLNTTEYFVSSLFLLLELVTFTKNRQLLNHLSALSIENIAIIPKERRFALVNKLVEAGELEHAKILINLDSAENGSFLPWHFTVEAMIKLKQNEPTQALQLIKDNKLENNAVSIAFYIALAQFYCNSGRVEEFLRLTVSFDNEFFNTAYLNEYISMGDLKHLVEMNTSSQIPLLQYQNEHNKLIAHWMLGDIEQCKTLIKNNIEVTTKNDNSKSLPNNRIFFKHIDRLLKSLEQHQRQTATKETKGETANLYIFGESHSLTLQNREISFEEQNYRAISKFIKGVKMHHLASEQPNQYKYYFNHLLKQVDSQASLFFIIGEIDCRINDGISKAAYKNNRTIDDVIDKTVINYIEYIAMALIGRNSPKVFIQGIQAPNIQKHDLLDLKRHASVIQKVNAKLKECTLNKGWVFIDIYSATCGADGWSNKVWHIDNYHLNPNIYSSATLMAIKK